MKKFFILGLLLGYSLFLSSCNAGLSTGVSAAPISTSSTITNQVGNNHTTANMMRSDSQGAVTVDVEPVNLDNPGDTMRFTVSMNTHSVNLNMDVATLATLTTDNGNTVQGIAWDGSSGGHHVSGTLSFPTNINGKSILDGATSLTLAIKNIDVSDREFTWDLSK